MTSHSPVPTELSENNEDSSDYTIDEEVLNLIPVEKQWSVNCYRTLNSQLNHLKVQEKINSVEAKITIEDMKLVKQLILKYIEEKQTKESVERDVSNNTESLLPNINLSQNKEKVRYKKRYSLADYTNGCYIYIIMDPKQKCGFFIPIKKLLKRFKTFMKELHAYMPIAVFSHVVKQILAKKLEEVLVGKEKMNYRSVLLVYREKYPEEGDEQFLMKTFFDIWLGKHNDTIEPEYEKEYLQVIQNRDPTKELTLEDIKSEYRNWNVVDDEIDGDHYLKPGSKAAKRRAWKRKYVVSSDDDEVCYNNESKIFVHEDGYTSLVNPER